MNVSTAVRYGLARLFLKASGFSVVSPWVRASFLTPTFERLTSDGYQKNSVVAACIQALTFTFSEPPLLVWSQEGADGEPLPTHPLRQILRNPNPLMGEDELWQYTIAYMALGGNAYWHKVRSTGGRVVELWPYHAGQVRPVPGGPAWVQGYEFNDGSTDWQPIPKKDIVHFKWPLPDPSQPWMAQPPLRSASRAVDTDSELDRYLYALLKNDAVPRTVIMQNPERFMTPEEVERAKAQWRERYGGESRGDVAILEAGATVQRLSLNLEELAFDALRRVPEVRIAAAFGVPPILAGLSAGLDASTYSNYQQARLAFTQDRLVPLWRSVAAEVQSSLASEFGNGVVLRHDLNEVASLQEDVNAKWARVNTAFQSGYITFNEARRAIGMADQPNADIYLIDPNKLIVPAKQLRQVIDAEVTATLEPPKPPPQLPPPAEPPEPAQDAPKAATGAKARPAVTARALQRIRRTLAKRMERAVDTFFDDLAERVVARAGKARKALPGEDELIEASDWLNLENTVKTFYVEIISASWETWNSALGVEVAFELSDPAVVTALKDAGTRIRGIADTTRDAVRDLLQLGASEGWTIDQLVRGDDEHQGLRDLVAQTYKRRARAIARTELGHAQQTAAAERYQAAGVGKVHVFDNGQDDPDEPCQQLNGTVQTLEWAKANALGHPNCTRAFAPHFDG